jgi:hypothetical protein
VSEYGDKAHCLKGSRHARPGGDGESGGTASAIGCDKEDFVIDSIRTVAVRQMVRAGKLGKKTGEGFYVWKDGAPA